MQSITAFIQCLSTEWNLNASWHACNSTIAKKPKRKQKKGEIKAKQERIFCRFNLVCGNEWQYTKPYQHSRHNQWKCWATARLNLLGISHYFHQFLQSILARRCVTFNYSAGAFCVVFVAVHSTLFGCVSAAISKMGAILSTSGAISVVSTGADCYRAPGWWVYVLWANDIVVDQAAGLSRLFAMLVEW